MRIRTLRSLCFVVGLAFVASLTLTACRDAGPAEEAGREVDEAVEDARDALEDLVDDAEDAVEDSGLQRD